MIHERPSLASRAPRECLIDRYAALAAERGAVDLTMATDEGAAPAELVLELGRALAQVHRYPDFTGDPALRARVAEERARRDGVPTDASEVVITIGATGGLAASLATLLSPGDELVTFTPGYSIPLEVALERGARVRAAPLLPTGSGDAARWTFDPDAVASLFGARTRVLLLTTPHSPTGKVFTARELELLVELCRRSGVTVVHDAVYEGFELGSSALSPRALFPRGTIVVGSASKKLRAPGLRIGWVTAPRALAARIGKLQEETTAGACLPGQLAIAAAMTAGDGASSTDRARLRERHERVRRALTALDLECISAEGGLCFVARRAGASSSDDLARALLARGIAAVPLSEFGPESEHEAAVRVGFARSGEVIARLERLGAES